MFGIDFGDDFNKLYSALETFGSDFTENYVKPSLMEASEPLKNKMVSKINQYTKGGTGQAAKNVRASLLKKKGEINAVAVYPRGYDRTPGRARKYGTGGNDYLRNMDKICYLEFGTSKNQDKKPIMQESIEESSREVKEILEKKLKQYAKDKGLI